MAEVRVESMLFGTSPLARVPFFRHLEEHVLLDLVARLRRQHYATGERIFAQGEAGTCLYIVDRGRVKISLRVPGEREVIVGLLGPGDFFGELSLLDGGPHSADAVATTSTEVVLLDRAVFLQFLREWPQVVEAVLAVVADRLRQNTTLAQDLALAGVRPLGTASPLETEIETLAREHQHLAHRDEALREILETLATNLHPTRTLPLIANAAARLLDAPIARLWLLDQQGELVCVAAGGPLGRPAVGQRLLASSTPGRVATGGTINGPAIDGEVLSPALAAPSSGGSVADGDRHAYLGVSIRRAGRPRGALEVLREQRWPFTTRDEAVLSSLAAAAALAVDQAPGEGEA